MDIDIDDLMVEATVALSQILKQADIRHVVIGGQAVKMLGSERRTKARQDIDVLVSCPGMEARNALTAKDARFVVKTHKMVFSAQGAEICIEFLQAGGSAVLKFPEIATAPILDICCVPILHPSMLICLKMRRWMHIAESTRPQPIFKAGTDAIDIKFLLKWLANTHVQLDFKGLDAQHEESLRQGFRLFSDKHSDAEPFLKSVLHT